MCLRQSCALCMFFERRIQRLYEAIDRNLSFCSLNLSVTSGELMLTGNILWEFWHLSRHFARGERNLVHGVSHIAGGSFLPSSPPQKPKRVYDQLFFHRAFNARLCKQPCGPLFTSSFATDHQWRRKAMLLLGVQPACARRAAQL